MHETASEEALHPAPADAIEEVVFESLTIDSRVAELAAEISRDYRGKDLLLVGVLKGAYIFLCDLVRQLTPPVSFDFLSISHFGAGRSSPQPVEITCDLSEPVGGRHLLIVEDIVDTGLSLHYLVGILQERQPASLAICTLLDRPQLRLADIPIRYVGFDVDESFLVGYGLDFRDRYRDLPYIATLKM